MTSPRKRFSVDPSNKDNPPQKAEPSASGRKRYVSQKVPDVVPVRTLEIERKRVPEFAA